MAEADDDDDDAGPRQFGPNYVTPGGKARFEAEHTQLLRGERSRVVREVADAAAQGDRSENAEYIYGKKRLREIDRRLHFLEKRLQSMVVVDPAAQKLRDTVYFGATVTIEDHSGQRKTLTLVGQDEIDLDRGHISMHAPIGRALLAKQVDDEVRVQAPGGLRLYVIVEISYP